MNKYRQIPGIQVAVNQHKKVNGIAKSDTSGSEMYDCIYGPSIKISQTVVMEEWDGCLWFARLAGAHTKLKIDNNE